MVRPGLLDGGPGLAKGDEMATLQFGQFKGRDINDEAVPLSYIHWLAKRGSYTEPGNRFVTTWKVPIVLSIEARREYERRTGNRWQG